MLADETLKLSFHRPLLFTAVSIRINVFRFDNWLTDRPQLHVCMKLFQRHNRTMTVSILLPAPDTCQLFLLLAWINFPLVVIGGFVTCSISQSVGNGVAWILCWLVLLIFVASRVK